MNELGLEIGCVITERDLDLLRFLELFRVLSLEQIWAAFFRKLGPESADYLFLARQEKTYGELNRCYHRLQQLAKAGYLERRFEWGARHVYRLGPAGLRHLRGVGVPGFKKTPLWPYGMRHDLLCSAFGLYFSRALKVTITSERQLIYAAWAARNAGQFRARSPLADMEIEAGKRYRIEIELSEKSSDRYLNLWQKLDFAAREEAPCALYIIEPEALQEKLLRLARRGYFPGIYVARLDDFRRHWRGSWRNFEGRTFELPLAQGACI